MTWKSLQAEALATEIRLLVAGFEGYGAEITVMEA
jgi:hypothetical protein